MWALLNAYFMYDKDPARAVRTLVEKRCFGAAFAGCFAAALCWVVFFWAGSNLSVWGLLWRAAFFWLAELTLCYIWAAVSGLFLNFFSDGNGPSALFVTMGLSGFVQGLLLCFAVPALVWPWLRPLCALAFLVTLLLRFVFVVLNTARAVQVGIGKALASLCFAAVPVFAVFLMCAGIAGLAVSWAL